MSNEKCESEAVYDYLDSRALNMYALDVIPARESQTWRVAARGVQSATTATKYCTAYILGTDPTVYVSILTKAHNYLNEICSHGCAKIAERVGHELQLQS